MRANYTSDIVTKTGPVVDARAYGSTFDDVTLQACINAIGSDKRTLLVAPGTWVLSDSLTIPININLRIPFGGVLQVATGKILTINGTLEAGPYLIFSGVGSVAFGNGYIKEVYPQWIGALGDNSNDDTAAIQWAIDTDKYAVLVAGTYKTTDTLTIDTYQSLHLMPNATIYGQAATSIPVVNLHASYASLTGSGFSSIIRTDNVSGGTASITTDGIINIGPIDEATDTNILWCQVKNFAIKGNSDRWLEYANTSDDNDIDVDTGIMMVNGDYFGTAGSNSCYANNVENIHFSFLGIGINTGPVVQGNLFSRLHYYRCTKYGLRFIGSNENCLSQTFFHTCPGINFVYLATVDVADPIYPLRGCSECTFLGLMGEPGATGPAPEGRYSRVYSIEAGCGSNYFQGNQNTGHSNLDAGSGTINSLGGSTAVSNASVTGELTVAERIALNSTATGMLVIEQTDDSTRATKIGYESVWSDMQYPVDTGEKIRFTFDGQDNESYGFMIYCKGLLAPSSSLSNSPFGIEAGNVLIVDDTTIAVDKALIYGHTFADANFVFTAAGADAAFYLDITNPTGDDAVRFTTTVKVYDPLSHLVLTSITVV